MPPADPALARLLDIYGQAEYDFAKATYDFRDRSHADRALARRDAARAALLDYLGANYVRREPPRDPSARATLARLDAAEAAIRASMTAEEYERFAQARHEAFLVVEEGQ